MIVTMAKIEVIGPKDLLVPVLATVERSGILQLDADIRERMVVGSESRLQLLTVDARTMRARLFYEDLAQRIERLLALLPPVPTTDTPVDPERVVASIAHVVDTDLTACEDRARRRDTLQTELNLLHRHAAFLTTVASLAPAGADATEAAVIAVEVRNRAALDRLGQVASRAMPGVALRSARGAGGSYIALLTTERADAERLRATLRDDQIPEVALPPYLEGLPIAEKIAVLQRRADSATKDVAAIDEELRAMAVRTRGLYQRVQQWLQHQLALLKTTALAFGTDNCFVLFGWVPSADLPRLKEALARDYGERVIVDEKEILQQELDAVPVALHNAAYFRPFELLVRLLPLPRYTSMDPTPFVAVFFPLFFGMILGDVGYGIVLAIVAAALVALARTSPVVQNAGRILGPCAAYSIVFGVLYGECFGEIGADALGLTPFIDRQTSFLPMLYFAVGLGTVHVIVGLALGAVTAMRGRRTREAAFRLTNALAIVCVGGILISYFAPMAALIRRPLIVAIAAIAPVLIVTGGLLAPFELLQYLGNIVSYVRLMAVGLASVLLASVANRLAGAAGSVWLGIAVAVLLHTFNLVLGVFAPTIHALRLHYVEFFSKFFEPGGKQYQPLKETR